MKCFFLLQALCLRFYINAMCVAMFYGFSLLFFKVASLLCVRLLFTFNHSLCVFLLALIIVYVFFYLTLNIVYLFFYLTLTIVYVFFYRLCFN